MSVLPKYQLKELFESGDLITQTSLGELIDASYNQTLVAGSNLTLNTVTTPSGTTVTINGICAGTGTVTSVAAGTGISITGTTTINPIVNIDYIGADNVILAATDGTALTILTTDRILLSAADTTAYYVNVSQLITAVGTTTASNGLTKTGVDTKLGGTLTVDTNLALDSFTLGITGEGNLNTEITFPTSINSIFDQTGADLFGLKALVPLPNGINGKGIMYVEDASNFIDSNAARILAGNLSDFGFPGTGTAINIGVGDVIGNIAESILLMFTDYAAGESTIYASTIGYDSGYSRILLSADHNDDIIYSGLQLQISGPTGDKAVILNNDNWSVQDDVNSTGYRFPWANGTAGQVLADDGNGGHDLEWVDVDQVSPFTVVTDAATITWDASTTPNGSITLGGNRTLNDPTGLVNGRTYNLVIKQDLSGFRLLTFGPIYKWSGGVAPTLSTGISATDFFTFIYDGTNLYGNAILNFS